MADYVLLADYFRQAVERDDKGFAVKTVRRHRGDVLTGLNDEDVARLLAAGAIRPVGEDPAEESDQVEGPDADDDPGSTPVPQERSSVPPKRTALKDDWVEFAVGKGFDRAEAEGMTKDELIEALA